MANRSREYNRRMSYLKALRKRRLLKKFIGMEMGLIIILITIIFISILKTKSIVPAPCVLKRLR